MTCLIVLSLPAASIAWKTRRGPTGPAQASSLQIGELLERLPRESSSPRSGELQPAGVRAGRSREGGILSVLDPVRVRRRSRLAHLDLHEFTRFRIEDLNATCGQQRAPRQREEQGSDPRVGDVIEHRPVDRSVERALLAVRPLELDPEKKQGPECRRTKAAIAFAAQPLEGRRPGLPALPVHDPDAERQADGRRAPTSAAQ